MAGFFSDYWLALVDGRNAWKVGVGHIALPIALSAVTLLADFPVAKSQVISVVSILAGLLFSMLVLLIDLRGRVRRGEDRRAAPGDRDCLNLDYAYYATSYAIATGFLAAGLLLVQEQVWDPLPVWARAVSNWVICALVINFALAVMHCLRRLRRCYEVFGKGNR